MLNRQDILATQDMIDKRHLDIRTITMGISLLDCCDTDLDRCCEKIYKKITTCAKDLVKVGCEIEKEFGIPIVNKRISVTPIALVAGSCETDSYVKIAQTMDAAAKTLTVEDTLCSKEEHTLQWLLHSLGEPVAEGSKVMIERKGIRLTIEPLEGLLPEAEIKDEYDVKINEGARGQYNKLVLPKQYHMKWQTASAKIHRIAVKLTVIKLEADDV